jgi:hypothetical protein
VLRFRTLETRDFVLHHGDHLYRFISTCEPIQNYQGGTASAHIPAQNRRVFAILRRRLRLNRRHRASARTTSEATKIQLAKKFNSKNGR